MPTRLYNKLGQAQDVELGGGDLFKYQESGWSLDKPATTIPELNASAKSPLYDSSKIKDNIASTGAKITNTENDLIDSVDYNAQVKKLLEDAQNINQFTSSELYDIESAGNAIGSSYEDEIAKAQRAKESGMGVSTIAGGRLGGFLNTQIAGVGAVREGVSDWAGAGGKLENIKSAYDANISDLQTKKIAAIEAAKQARKEYIRTGKATALQAVQNALAAAQTINNNILANQQTKQDMLIKAAQEARTAKTAATTDAQTYISNMATAGLDATAIPEETKRIYEQSLGLPTGTFNDFYADIKTAAQFQKEGRYADFSAKIASILKDIPQGQTITIGGQTYQGTETTTSTNSLDNLLSPTEAAALGVPYGTTKAQAAEQGVIPKEKLTGKEKIDMEVKLAGNFEQYAKETRSAQRQINIMEQGYNSAVQAGFDGSSNNAPSQAVLVTFQKLLDPTSVVRESEYARSGDGQSILQRMQGTIEKLQRGGAGVTQAELKNFYDLSQQLLKGYEGEQKNFASRIQTQAKNYGLNIENILTPDVLDLLNQSGSENNAGGTTGGDINWEGL